MDWSLLIAAFGGGVLGAALGAVPVFVLTGVLALAGVVGVLGGHPEILQIAFGPVLGPHVSFSGGVAAAAFAARRGVIERGRDVATPLMGLKRVDVLLVGGAFGSLGYLLLLACAASGIAAWTDPVAAVVVASNIVARYMFGRTGLLGAVGTPTGRRFRPDDSASWLPWQQDWAHVLTIGFAVSAVAAALLARSGLPPGTEAIGFSLSTISLGFLLMGTKVPVTHHISMTASLAVVHGGGVLAGVVFGMLGAVLGEAASRATLIHGDTHIDPPAVAIALVATLLLVLRAAGVSLPPI